jgi:hypothetical protein
MALLRYQSHKLRYHSCQITFNIEIYTLRHRVPISKRFDIEVHCFDIGIGVIWYQNNKSDY